MILSLGSRWCGRRRRRRSSGEACWHNDPHVTCLRASWTEICARDAWSCRCPLISDYYFTLRLMVQKIPQSRGAREAAAYPSWSSAGQGVICKIAQKNRRRVPLMGKAQNDGGAEQREDELFPRGSQVCCIRIQLMFHCVGSQPALKKRAEVNSRYVEKCERLLCRSPRWIIIKKPSRGKKIWKDSLGREGSLQEIRVRAK